MTDSAELFLVVGLGNPGPHYAGNRHNIGFLVVDELAARVGGKFKANKGSVEVLETRFDGHRVVLAKPLSYMNVSGGPVVNAAKYYGAAPANIIVVHDELDLPFGTLRMKLGGGENGHNGLRSISKSLATKDYLRVRFGIGRPPGRQDAADFVLKDFSSVERKELPLLIAECADATETIVTHGLTIAQNQFHSR